MISHIFYGTKAVPVVFSALLVGVLAVLADASPYTPWILGALVPISMALLGYAWKINTRLTTLETQVSPLWSALQKEIADTLHHPHPESRELDKLLEDLEHLRLTPEKTIRLKILLREKADDTNEDADERRRAELLLFVMSKVVIEAKMNKV
jgi:hypothetical protein